MKSIQQSVNRGSKLPHENSDDAERYSDSEEREHTEDPEREESPEDFEKEAREAADDLERREAADRLANDASDELDEMESKSKEVEDHNDFERENEVDKEQSMDDELGHDLDEVRDDLHDKFVNDMERQLEEPSTKEVEGEETDEDGTSSEMTESSESYEDAGDGMAYAMETKSETEGHAQSDVENEAEHETQESTESSEPVDEKEESYEDKTTNRITKSEHGEEQEESEPRTTASTQEGEARSLSKTESDEAMEEPDSEPSVEESPDQEKSEAVETEEPEVHESTTEEEPASEIDEPQSEEQSDSPDFETESGEVSESEETSEYQQELTEYQDDLHEVSEHEEEAVESELSESEVSELEDQETPVETDESVGHELTEDATEDFTDRVEELLESFEEPGGDSDERFVVEALTGEKVRDRTLEPRSFFGESDEDDVEEEIRAWLRELFGELTEEERERFKELVRARLKTDEDLDALLKRHPSVKRSSDYKQKLRDARSYIKGKRSGPVPKLIRDLWALEVEREWTRTIGAVFQRRVRRQLDSKLKESQQLQVWTQERLDDLLAENEKLKQNKLFKDRYRNAISWIILMKRLRDGLVDTEPSADVLKELSKEFMVSSGSLRKWLKGEQKPMLIVQLERRLGIRSSPGGKQQPLVKPQSQTSYIEIEDYLDYLGAKGTLKRKVKKFLHAIISNTEKRVWFVEIPSEFSDVLAYINDNEIELERELSKGFREVRLKVLGDRLYVRNKTRDPFLWTDLLADELFYLERKWKRVTLGKMLGHLNLNNLKELSEIIRGLTEYGTGKHVPVGGLNADLQSKSKYLSGHNLGFVLEVLGLSISDVKQNINSLGKSYRGKWQIQNPLFPTGSELQTLLARLFAIIASDGHIDHRYSLSYCEENSERRLRVRELLNQIGEVWILDIHDPDRGDSLQLPPVLGRLMHKIGVPVGDKVIQGFGVPSFILDGSPELLAAYLEELIPEEGSVTYAVYGGLKILWGRTVVLHEERASKLYASPMRLSKNLIKFVKDNGDYEERRQCYRVSAGKLRRLKKSTDPDVARLATELDMIARANPSLLQTTEQKLCRKLGIKTGRHLCYVRFYTTSGRVSAHWEAHTSSQQDVERWWRIAPPNDVKKRARLDDYFLKKRDNDEVS